MPIERKYPESRLLKVSEEVAEKVKQTVLRLREEGFKFDFEETPDTYVVTTKDEKGKEKRTHITKLMGGNLPLAGGSLGIEDFIEARLRYPDDDINIAVRKLEEDKE